MKHSISKLLAGVLATSSVLFSGAAMAEDCCCGVHCGDETCFTVYGEAVVGKLCQELPHVSVSAAASPDYNGDVFLKHAHHVGFRTGAVLNVPCHEWGLNVDWIYLKSAGTKHSVDGPGTMTAGLANETALITEARDSVTYNVVDVLAGYPVHMCEGLSIRPYSGFRLLVIDRKYSETNTNGSFTGGGDDSSASIDYTGCGMASGFDWSFATGCDLALFGRVGASVVRGEQKLDQSVDVGGTVTLTRETEPCHSTISTDVVLGVAYTLCLCDTDISLYGKYESSVWGDLRNPLSAGANCMTVHGYTFGANIAI